MPVNKRATTTTFDNDQTLRLLVKFRPNQLRPVNTKRLFYYFFNTGEQVFISPSMPRNRNLNNYKSYLKYGLV